MSRPRNKSLLRKPRPRVESNSKKLKIKKGRTEAKNGALELRTVNLSKEIIGFINVSELLDKLHMSCVESISKIIIILMHI